MASSKEIVRGVAAWVDSEILPMMTGTTKYSVGVLAALLGKQGEAMLEKAKSNDAVTALGLVRDGEYDVDMLRTVMLERFPAEGLRIDAEQINGIARRFLGKLGAILNVQVEGGITFHKSDVEKLFGFIKGG